jgi:hypothetical protein
MAAKIKKKKEKGTTVKVARGDTKDARSVRLLVPDHDRATETETFPKRKK